MTHWQPILRKGFNPPVNEPFTLAPLNNFMGCVLAEQTTVGTNIVFRFRLYAGKNADGLMTSQVQYTPTPGGIFYVIDIPMANVINLAEIAVAIVNGSPNLPPPPVVWG
jgi:hypothetical protein